MSFHPNMPYGSGLHRSERKLAEPGPEFAYTPEHRTRFETIVARYPPEHRRSAILPALHLVQAQQGYITGNAMTYVAGLLGCSAADVEDVVSFYTMYFTRPVGRYVLQVCRTLSCALCGAERLTAAFEEKLGIRAGETDPTGTFTLLEVECLGACDRGPVVMVNDDWHECARPEEAAALVDALRERGPAALTGCHLCVEKTSITRSGA
ncbi:MAG TPA: NADH-quinone oxidoreductase subunit NuoE [Vicinamibacterales bacterium]|nr:NADH-quinone oxidoreductase subunit NuoE [Vicinamibacterales bacterium]